MNTLIVGLGNPGPFYANTRHQIGQVVVEMTAAALRAKFEETDNGLVARTSWKTKDSMEREFLSLQIPTCGMNLSGTQIKSMLEEADSNPVFFEGGGFDRFFVVHDDMAIPFGQIRIKKNSGNHAGNNGIRSIVEQNVAFTQIKIGIGAPTNGRNALEHALSPFEPRELAELHSILLEAKRLAIRCGTEGKIEAMTVNVLKNETTLPSFENESIS